MQRARLFLAAAFVLLVAWFTATSTYGFDIAIYKDPLSWFNERFIWHHNEHPNQAYQDFLDSLGYDSIQMQAVYRWYADMGITKVMVNYPYPGNFLTNDWAQDCTHVGVMNWFYPGLGTMHGAKYVDAQYRDVQVGNVWPSQNGFWSFDYSLGTGATRGSHTENGGPAPNQRQAVAISGSADTMWRPQSYLGKFSGWDGTQTGMIDNNWYMPMHFKVTWAVDSDEEIDTTQALAYFYWMVHTPSSSMYGYDNVAWWRFPARPIILQTQGQANNWITTEFVDSANAGYYNILDDNFTVLDSVPWYDVRFGPAEIPNALDDIYLGGVAYGARTDVRMSVHYEGQHTFYLNRLEAYDEGAYRMFASPIASQWADSIYAAFQSEYNNSYGRSCGWYYDEYDNSGEGNGLPVLRSIVKVDSILQAHNLPTMYINGYSSGNTWGRTPFRTELNNQGVHMRAHMSEFYLFGGGGHPDSAICEPCPNRSGGSVTEFLWTSDSTDRAYLDLESCGEGYHGIKSLQCTIDEFMFGAEPLEEPYELPNEGEKFMFALPDQVKFAHDSLDSPMWALVAGGSDGLGQGDQCYAPIRTPTPNEVKLTAWLAIASNVDGLMWYNWDFGGLIEWDNGTFDTTANYAAAQKVCDDIGHITPVLQSLDYVKTYASRAFRHEYPYSSLQATWLDTLATNCTWYYDQEFRAVEEILTWKTSDGSWLQEPDSASYVQVSRFKNRLIDLNDPDVEDFWFLIVNRRARSDERRKVRLLMQIDTTYLSNPYYVDYMLGDSTRSAEPCAGDIPTCANRYVDVILDPGEAELVHFYRGELGCDVTEIEISNLTAYRSGPNQVRLRWESIGADMYFICGSPRAQGPWTAFAFTQDTTYVDTVFSALPKYFYTVQGCWNNSDGDGGDHP